MRSKMNYAFNTDSAPFLAYNERKQTQRDESKKILTLQSPGDVFMSVLWDAYTKTLLARKKKCIRPITHR